MNTPKKYQAELTKICDDLRKALNMHALEEWRQIIIQAIQRAERLASSIAGAPAALGSRGGRKTAERPLQVGLR